MPGVTNLDPMTVTITVNGEQLVGPNNTLPTAELLTQTVTKAAG